MDGPARQGRPRPDVISFGVFGTLIDRDQALAAALGRAGVSHPAQVQAVVEAWQDAAWELADELESFRPWRELAEEALARAAARSGTLLTRTAAAAAIAGLADGPLFPDVVPALLRLAARWPIALVSNADRPDVERVAARLGVPVARIVTSGDVETYKPEPDLLLALLHELELDEDRLLHVGAIPEYDLFTAEDLGIPAAFIDRAGSGLPEDLSVAWSGRSLEELAAWLDQPRPGGRPGGSRPGDRPGGSRPGNRSGGPRPGSRPGARSGTTNPATRPGTPDPGARPRTTKPKTGGRGA